MAQFRTASTLALAAALALPVAAGAQLGTRSAEEWIKTLESTNRLEGLKVSETVASLKLQPGQIVADIGAGTGVFSLPMAREVRPGGTVYAVEVDEQLLAHIAEMATEQGVINVQPVYGEYDDPLLPVPIDVAFIHDVLHHIEKRDVYLKNLAGYLKPTGRIVVIDFIPGQGGHRDDNSMQLTKEQVTELMAQAGMKPVEELKLFENKYYLIFGKS